MCSNMKSYYFSVYFGYNMLSLMEGVNPKKLTWMELKVTITLG